MLLILLVRGVRLGMTYVIILMTSLYFVHFYCYITLWTISALFTTGNRLIDLFKSNQTREPTSGALEPIETIQP